MNHHDRPGALNEHDYYTTRDSVDPSTSNEGSEQQDATTDGLQVLMN